MNYQVLKEENFNISNWTGGKTTELGIFPESGSYLKRDFVWRLSTATCEKEESSFSKLPDFERVLLVLSGNVVLAHQDVRAARLNELEQDRFDGAYSTKSFGQITDYNLMVAKGNQGFLDVIILEEQSFTPETENYPEYDLITQAYYCRDGFATVTVNGETVMVNQGQQLIINYEKGENLNISVMGEGHLIRGQIFYNYKPEEMGPIPIPREKGTFKDFLTCIYLSMTQFRGAKFIFKKLKTQWFDEELSRAIKKIEQLYLPFVIFTIGICGIAYIGLIYLDTFSWIIAMIGWLIVDTLLISPLIYYMVLPKPTAAHIKDIDHLTPYEQKVRDREINTNERLDKLLKKYKNSGRYEYQEEPETKK